MSTDLKFCRCLCALSCTLLSVCAPAQTLNEVVQQALASYPALATARAKMEAAQADIARARSGHYPQISMGLSANSYASGAMPSAVGKTTLSPTAKVNLWSGGRIQAETERAQALTSASEAQRQVTQEDVALLATEAYLNWSKTSELHNLSVRNLQAHQETLDDIRKIAAADMGRRIDLEQAQVRVDNARLHAQQRESDLMQAMQRVRRFWTGVLNNQPEDVAGVVALGGALGVMPVTQDDAASHIKDELPTLAQHRAQVLAAEAAVRQAKGLHMPSIDLVASRQFNGNTLRFDTLTQVQLNMPLYNGNSVEAQVEAAVAQLRAAQASLDEARLMQREKVSAAWQEWVSMRDRAQLGGKQSDVGDKVVDGYRLQFRLARRSLLDLLNIQADAFNYRSNSLTAVHDERIARARLLAAMGVLSERFEPGGALASAVSR